MLLMVIPDVKKVTRKVTCLIHDFIHSQPPFYNKMISKKRYSEHKAVDPHVLHIMLV